MKKVRRGIQINFTNRWLYTLIFFGILILIGAIVYAYSQTGGGNPLVMGHDPSEVGPGTFSNSSTLDNDWIFPGDVVIGGLAGKSGNTLAIDEDGRVYAQEPPSTSTDRELVVFDEFLGSSSLSFSSSSNGALAFKTELGHPGMIKLTSGATSGYYYYYLPEAVSSGENFDVSFYLKSDYATGFSGMSGMAVGLFDAASMDGTAYVSKQAQIAFERRTYVGAIQTRWIAMTSVSGTAITTTEKLTPYTITTTPGVWTKFRVRRVDSNTVGFSIDDQPETTVDTNIPSSTTNLIIGVLFRGNSRDIQIDNFKLSVSGIDRKSLICSGPGLGIVYDSGCTNPTALTGCGNGAAYTPQYNSINVPSACTIGIGCVIKQIIYNTAGGIVQTKSYSYKQESTGYWISSYTAPTSYKNGDSTSSNIVSSYYSSTILLRDDASSVETNNAQWTARDATTKYRHTLEVCSYSTS